jgi:hypothetical protein
VARIFRMDGVAVNPCAKNFFSLINGLAEGRADGQNDRTRHEAGS